MPPIVHDDSADAAVFAQLRHVEQRLVHDFGHAVPEDAIRAVVHFQYRRFERASVRQYIAVLVARAARDDLRSGRVPCSSKLRHGMMRSMDADAWNERYAAAERVWSVTPNVWFAEVAGPLPPGRALDLACGEGRNAVWLAERGWQVTAVDFAGVALDRGRAASTDVDWVEADVRTWQPPAGAFDLVGIVYLHLPADERRAVLASAAASLAPGGLVVVIGHAVRNLTEGVGGPQDPAILLDADVVAAELAALDLDVERSDTVERPTDAGVALDTLTTARRR